MSDCVFCKIRDGQIPSVKIHEDERTFAIMDINPINSGHCLVIMKTHAPTVWDAQPADLQAAITAARKVALAIRDTSQEDISKESVRRIPTPSPSGRGLG